MRQTFILNAPVQLESGGTSVPCLGGSLVVLLTERAFAKVADWLKVQ